MQPKAHATRDGAPRRIVLFHCARYNRLTPIVTMGLWGLADILTRHGFPTQIVHTGVEAELHGDFDIARYIDDDVLLAGFSLHWLPAAAEVLDLAAEVKRRSPATFVVLGGFTSSFFWRDILDLAPAVDGVLRGDAEQPLLELAESLARRAPALDGVRNLAWRSPAGITENPQTFVATSADLRDVSLGRYRDYLAHYDFARTSQSFAGSSALVADFDTDFGLNPMFYLLTGKGCLVNCSMCGGGHAAQVLMNGRDECMYLEPDTILRTIREGLDHGYRRFYVCFDPLPPKPRYLEWFRRIREEGLDIDLCFGFWGLPSAEALDELSRTSRNVLVDLSPETISEESRWRNKGHHYSNAELHATLDGLYQRRIYTHVYFSYFLPSQTEQELADTRRAFWDLNVRYPHYIEATILKISTDPASPLFRDPARFGVRLAVSRFADLVEKCRENPTANILVHEIDSLPAPVTARYERIFRFDTGLKRLFRYYTKLLVRAFPSVEEFLAFLDGFYEEAGLLGARHGAPGFETPSDILAALDGYVQRATTGGVLHAAPYLRDLVAYVRALAEAREGGGGPAANGTGARSAVRGAVLRLAPWARLLALEHDVPAAKRHLRTHKEFTEVAATPVRLLLGARNGKPDIRVLNDSMYRLCQAVDRNTASRGEDLAAEVAAQFTDEAAVAASIREDLLGALTELAEDRWVSLA